jgi:hypothetical protein
MQMEFQMCVQHKLSLDARDVIGAALIRAIYLAEFNTAFIHSCIDLHYLPYIPLKAILMMGAA